MDDYNFDRRYMIDEDEDEQELEVQRMWLQKQAEERQLEIKKQREEFQKVKGNYDENELEKIQKQTEYNENVFLPSKYMYCYKYEILNNDLLGKCSLHFILGGLLRHKKIYKTPYTWLDYRVHLILFQMSGTGKGMTANFIERLLEHTKFPIVDFDKNELKPFEEWRDVDIKVDGKATPESLINSYLMKDGAPLKDNEGNLLMRNGALQIKDYFIYEEGGKLFTGSQMATEMTDHFLKSMEPIGSSNNKIEKDLTSYEKPIITTSKSSIFIMTRPIGKLHTQVAQSGFFQRCLFIPREIDYSIIHNMRVDSGINDLNYMGGQYSAATNKYFNDLIEEFKSVIEFSYNYDIKLNPSKLNDIKEFYKNKMNYFYNDMMENMSLEEHKHIMSSLQNRYKDNVYKLAYHSACMRYSKYVDLEDFQYAFNLITELYGEQKEWLYENVQVNQLDKKEKDAIKKMAYTYINNNLMGSTLLNTISKKIANEIGTDYNVVVRKLLQFSTGKNSLFEVTGAGNSRLIKIKK